jgi:hypothetical protein
MPRQPTWSDVPRKKKGQFVRRPKPSSSTLLDIVLSVISTPRKKKKRK